MGCELGKLANSSRDNRNGGKSEESAPQQQVDPRLPLTAKQKYSMMASWKGISRAMESTGVCMFLKLFEEHSELLLLFEKFKTLRSKEEQATSLELAEHAVTVMSTLDEGIKGLDDLDTFFEYLHQVGASHRRIPGFKPEYFWFNINPEQNCLTKSTELWAIAYAKMLGVNFNKWYLWALLATFVLCYWSSRDNRRAHVNSEKLLKNLEKSLEFRPIEAPGHTM